MITVRPQIYSFDLFVADLWTAAHVKDGSRPRARGGIAAHLRAVARRHGKCNPFGDGDSKTDAPGWYRPVGTTCPDSCPYTDSCYALTGNVAIHQRAAFTDVLPSIRAAACAIVWGQASNRPVRAHVSGDFGKTWDEPSTVAYVSALIALCNAVERVTGRKPEIWTYTHLPRSTDGQAIVARLNAVGVSVRWSDYQGYNGAIVAPHNDLRRVRTAARTGRSLFGQFVKAARNVAKCPAQLRSITCADCRLCWTSPELVIAFDPHGAASVRAATASPATRG
ncbi:MAG: hypothetical protein GY772_20345 [bacterium]|nr:hypothetical protein [bacterium]